MDVVQAQVSDKPRSEPLLDLNLDVLSALADPDLSITGVASLIATDPSLTAALLRQANSPFYGCSRKITTIRDAVNLIGLEEARDLVLAATVKAMVSTAQSQPADDWGTEPGRAGSRMPVRASVPA